MGKIADVGWMGALPCLKILARLGVSLICWRWLLRGLIHRLRGGWRSGGERKQGVAEDENYFIPSCTRWTYRQVGSFDNINSIYQGGRVVEARYMIMVVAASNKVWSMRNLTESFRANFRGRTGILHSREGAKR